jgi:hypothetical protein
LRGLGLRVPRSFGESGFWTARRSRLGSEAAGACTPSLYQSLRSRPVSGEATTNCGYCGEPVDPADEDVVYARELVLGETFFGGRTFTE